MNLIKMSSIGRFSNIIKDIKHDTYYMGKDENNKIIYDKTKKIPSITFNGTIKLHGTNASICYNGTDIWFQSKENILKPEKGKDNAGFATYMIQHIDYLKEKFKLFDMTILDEVCIYGEWAGGNIQKGVSIQNIEKSFFMFSIKTKKKSSDDFTYLKLQTNSSLLNMLENKENKIYSIFKFKTYNMTIDINTPLIYQNALIKLTEEVDKLCPVGEYFGFSGHGEGIVWTTEYNNKHYAFKVKGESHSNSKVRKLKPVDEELEQRKIDFANYACKPWRLEQMYQETFDTLNGGKGNISKTGDFIRAVVRDIHKEELEELSKASLTAKDVNSKISQISKQWLFKQIDNENFI